MKYQLIVIICIVGFCLSQIGYSQPNYWQQTNGPFGGTVFVLDSYQDGHVLAGTSLGVAYSSDGGVSWNSNLNLPDKSISAVCIASSHTLFAGSNRGLYRSTDNGKTWTNDSSQLGNAWVYAIDSKTANSIFVGTIDAIYRSSDMGNTWKNVSSGLSGHSVYSFLFDDGTDTIIAGTGQGVYRSMNNGNSWSRLDSQTITSAVFSLAKSRSGTIFAGASHLFYRSTNNGINWTLDNTGLHGATVNCIAVDSNGIVFAGTNHGIFRSIDDGVHWNKITTNLPNFAYEIFSVLIDSTNALQIGTYDGIFRSTDSGITWISQNDGLRKVNIRTVCSLSNGVIYAMSDFNGAFFSLDLGNTWSRFQSNSFSIFSSFDVFGISPKGHLFTGGAGHIFRSTNNGTDWDTLINGLPNYIRIYRFRFDSLGGIYASGHYGVYKSLNDGIDWTNVTSALTPYVFNASIDMVNNGTMLMSAYSYLFENDYVSNIYRSVDYGSQWHKIGSGLGLSINGPIIRDIAISPNSTYFAIVSSPPFITRVFSSYNFGDSWHQLHFDSTVDISHIVINAEGKIYLGGNGVYTSTDNGISWSKIVSGLRNAEVSSLSISNKGYLFAGTNNGVYRSVQPTTAIKNSHTNIPLSYSLSQNYPNPFNPTTTISFELPKRSYVTLQIYDFLGREIHTLVSGVLDVGTYTRTWNGANMTSGVYFYRIEAGDFCETRKFILLK